MRRGFLRPATRVLESPRYFYDGIHLDFRYGAGALGCYVKAAGAAPTIAPLTTLFTFTGGNQSMYMGPAGLLVASATNTPRIEYDASGNCLGLLMEAARTNLVTQSQTLDNVAWNKAQCSISADAATAPDGTTTADKIVEDGTSNIHLCQNSNVTYTSGTVYTFSAFVKASGRTFVSLQVGAAAFTSVTGAYWNLTTGAVGTTLNSPTSTSIQSVGNGWYRVSFTKAATASAGAGFNLYPASADGVNNYTGDSASGILVWGAQIEAGAFPSSYIPTTTTSVARTADSCIRTLGSEFSATAGTVHIHGRAGGGQDSAGNQVVWSFDDTTTAERIQFTRVQATDTGRVVISDGGASQCALDSTLTNSAIFRHATAWSANDFASSFNGAAVLTDSAGTLPTVTLLGLGVFGAGTGQMNGHITQFDYYPTRLPNGFLTTA